MTQVISDFASSIFLMMKCGVYIEAFIAWIFVNDSMNITTRVVVMMLLLAEVTHTIVYYICDTLHNQVSYREVILWSFD